MKTALLYFDVKDTEYFNRLGEFIKLNYSRYLTVSKVKDNSDYVVSDYLNKRNSKNIILIKDFEGDIYKYQRASQICNDLISRVFKEQDISEDQSGSRPMVYCITSAAGGAGKTTVSLAIAKYITGTGRDVLYINPNPASAGEIDIPEESGNNLTKLLYYLNSKTIKSGLLLSKLAVPCKDGSYDCIVNSGASPDGIPGADCADKLLDVIYNDTLHDVVIIDYPSFMADSLLNIIQKVDAGILVSDNNPAKREQIFNQYILSKCGDNIIVVKNRSSIGENSIPLDSGFESAEFCNAISKIVKKAENTNDY